MNLWNRRRHQNEKKKFEDEVNKRLENTKAEMDQIQIAMEPNDVEITSTRRGFWEISRAPHEIRSHHLKINVTKYVESFDPSSLLDYFIGPYPYKTFIIRYHGAPRYWSDALEMNDWMTGEQMDDKWETELKKTSKEKKSSIETSEISSMNENQEEEEEVNTLYPANMNVTNVLIVSNQVPDEVKKEDKMESDSDDSSDLDRTLENENNENWAKNET